MNAAAITVFAIAITLSAVIYGVFSTGPNCPNMDPSYIGWCK